ncbi:MAG: efflux RND transporter permease subunit [Bacteroidales bacterium]|nr:efflux RND transporter permease subunit [Bacteroidales bacterium]MDY0348538.1 efflux RND transporter permease subunit [Tenuifilaceae bacterium]
MSIYKTAIDKPVTTLLIFVGVVIIGLFSLLRLPIDLFPELEPPFISVMTAYPGASASEIETNVTRLLENRLNAVDGLKELNSSSKDNMSMVFLELEWGTNLDEAINDVRSYLDMVKDQLPSGASNPFIFKFSSSAMPIIQFAVTAEESYAGLEKILEESIIPQLNRVNGIGNISLSGSPERYIYVDLNQEKLDAYNLPLEVVGAAVSNNNLNLSSGTVKMKKEQYQLQVRTEYIESSEIENLVVTTTPDGKSIYVRDIAQVRDTIKDLSLDEKINGQDGVRIIISKQSGANTVQICEDVTKEMEKIKKILPPDIEIEVIYDSSLDIKDSISSLEKSILYALIFVVLVVLFFLGRWRATLIIAITIPIALIVSFVYLAFVGSSLNIISLSSLTVAIGMVVDDAIVVLENITRHIERGSSPREAAKYATNEVWVSVIATTLVIVAVFVPLTMLSGMAGVMFKELGWIVTIVVATSTLVAISLTPMLASKLLKSKKIEIDENGKIIKIDSESSWYDKYAIGFMDKMDEWYAKALRYCLRHKTVTVLAVIVLFIASLLPVGLGFIGTDFMQQTDDGRVNVKIELNRGTRIEETLKTARHLENRFMALVPEIRMLSTSAGSSDEAGVASLFTSTTNNTISMNVVCTKKVERDRSIFEIAEILRKEMEQYPEIIDYQAQVAGGAGSNKVEVEVYGYDFDMTNVLAENIRRTLRDKVETARDITISREEERAELKVVFDKEKLAIHGLNSSTAAVYVRNRVSGMPAGFLKEDGDEYNIVVRMEEKNRNSITAIEDLTIPTPRGGKIKLREVASVDEYWSLPNIMRKSRQRIVSVEVTPYKTSLGELAVAIEDAIKDIEIPQGATVRIAGDYEDQQETFADMGLLMLLIVMLVYIVMASQFESFTKPFIIMMSVPFAITGVILALLVTGTTFDMIGALGAIMLVGIVVKNGIVLVDYINLMRDRGHELYDAIALAGASRLRPVLMTAFTTILGMLPMALSQGEGSEMWRPMGIVVIGGLLVSTVITLIVIPVLYGIISRHGERDKEERIRKEFVFMQIKNNNGNGNSEH